jgi:GTP cyclohydrolase III
MPVGNVLVATVTWQNTGTQSYAFDVAVCIGKGTNPSDFQIQAANIVQNVSSNPNDIKTTNVQIGPLDSRFVGTWDIMVLIGDYDSSTGKFDLSKGDWLVCTNVLVVG